MGSTPDIEKRERVKRRWEELIRVKEPLSSTRVSKLENVSFQLAREIKCQVLGLPNPAAPRTRSLPPAHRKWLRSTARKVNKSEARVIVEALALWAESQRSGPSKSKKARPIAPPPPWED